MQPGDRVRTLHTVDPYTAGATGTMVSLPGNGKHYAMVLMDFDGDYGYYHLDELQVCHGGTNADRTD